MRKLLLYLSFLQLFFVSCEEIYHPDMDTVSGQLVVDARITNDLTKNYIHLSKTRHFYDDQPVLNVSGATVSLVELGGSAIRAYESSTGYYSFYTVPESGKKYFLRIIIQNVTYESRAVTMPPVPTLTNFNSKHVITVVNENSGESTPRTYERPEREITVDMPLTDALSYYRLNIRSLLQWTLHIPKRPSFYPLAYGWNSFENREQFHLLSPKNQAEPGKIINHQLLTLSYTPFNPTAADTMKAAGWIIFVEQYGTSKESFEYHTQLNSQFAATGSLFDPIQTQVYGNILCKSKPSEIVYGYFNLCSFQQYRYFLIVNTPPGMNSTRQLYSFPVIPDFGMVSGKDSDPPLKPSWWQE